MFFMHSPASEDAESPRGFIAGGIASPSLLSAALGRDVTRNAPPRHLDEG
jgi:hypothetical protein